MLLKHILCRNLTSNYIGTQRARKRDRKRGCKLCSHCVYQSTLQEQLSVRGVANTDCTGSQYLCVADTEVAERDLL